MSKKFIGGYYVKDLDIDMNGLAFEEVKILTLTEALRESAICCIIEMYEEEGRDFYLLNDKDKREAIEEYILLDDIFGGAFYNEEEVVEILEELKENKKRY